MMKKLLVLSAACLLLTGCSASAGSSEPAEEESQINARVSVAPLDEELIGSWSNGKSGYRFQDNRKVSLIMDYSDLISFDKDFNMKAGGATIPAENISYDGTNFSAVMTSESEMTEVLTMTRTDKSTANTKDLSGQYYFRSGALASTIVEPFSITPEQAIIIADVDTAANTFEITLYNFCDYETNDGLLELFSPNFTYVDAAADSISYNYTITGDTLKMVYSGTENTETYTRTEDKPVYLDIDNNSATEPTEETTE